MPFPVDHLHNDQSSLQESTIYIHGEIPLLLNTRLTF